MPAPRPQKVRPEKLRTAKGQTDGQAPGDDRPSRALSHSRDRAARPILILIAFNVAIEAVLAASDAGLIAPAGLRDWVYRHGAFWTGQLYGAAPLYPGQPVAMFLTHAVLHGGLLHLALNMVALWGFGIAIIRRAGTRRFALAYIISALGGAAAYALITPTPAPMVGASGALFGLLGVWICWDYLDRRHYGEPLRSTYRALLYLVLYNLAFWVLLAGRLAWEAHLGGFVAGWVLALAWGRPPARRRAARKPAP